MTKFIFVMLTVGVTLAGMWFHSWILGMLAGCLIIASLFMLAYDG